MGYRLYFAQHFNPDWKGGFLNRDFDKWDVLFYEKFSDNGYKDEDSSIYDIERKDVENYIEELKTLPSNDKNKFFQDDDDEPDSGYTNAQVIEILETILTSDDDTIRIEWF
jgi:hypothetical protein